MVVSRYSEISSALDFFPEHFLDWGGSRSILRAVFNSLLVTTGKVAYGESKREAICCNDKEGRLQGQADLDFNSSLAAYRS